MKKFYLFLFSFMISLNFGISQYGHFASAVYIENSGVTQFYNCNAHGSPNAVGTVPFSGSLGTFTQNSGSLKIRGAEIKTWKGSSGNVCTPKLNYRITSGSSFSQFDINFYCNCSGSSFCGGGPCGGNDQKWQTPGNGGQTNIDLTTFSAGSYNLEVYFDVPGNSSGASGCPNNITDNNGGSNYIMSFTIQAPLPVKYQNFDISRKSSVNYLQWTTASETNNEYFEVQHSTDGRQFEAVGQVKGYGNSNTERDYYFSHEVSGTAISYYRLKQVDFDGKYEYSGIISVRSENDRWDESIAVSPNPVADFLLVTGISEQADYMITDYSGRQLMTGSVVSGQGLDVSTLSSGFYTLIVQEGAQKSAHKWIKK